MVKSLYTCIWMGKLWRIEQVFHYILMTLTMLGWENFGESMDDHQIRHQCFILPTFHPIEYQQVSNQLHLHMTATHDIYATWFHLTSSSQIFLALCITLCATRITKN